MLTTHYYRYIFFAIKIVCNFFRGNGTTLVICSEGNAGFYEIGIMITPMKNNYSVLGWNHPGFGGSSVSQHLRGLNIVYKLSNNNQNLPSLSENANFIKSLSN